MNFREFIKTKRGRVILLVAVLALAFLCVIGIRVLGVVGSEEDTIPVISLAAEPISLPFSLPLFGDSIPNTLTATWLTMIILIALSLGYYRAQRKEGPPGRFQTAVEALGEGMYSFMVGIAGEHARRFFPLVATFFLFIVISNWCGILPGFGSIGVWGVHHAEEAVAHEDEQVAHEGDEVTHEGEDVVHEDTEGEEHGEDAEHEELVLIPFFRSANAHLSTTLALAIVSVVATHYYGFRIQGVSYSQRFLNFRATSPKPDMSGQGRVQRIVSKMARGVEAGVNGIVGLLEIILETLKVLPFSFRLFGNIFAGEVLLFIVSYLFAFVFPMVFLGLEIFVGLIQGLVFALLTLVFLSVATISHHGEEH